MVIEIDRTQGETTKHEKQIQTSDSIRARAHVWSERGARQLHKQSTEQQQLVHGFRRLIHDDEEEQQASSSSHEASASFQQKGPLDRKHKRQHALLSATGLNAQGRAGERIADCAVLPDYPGKARDRASRGQVFEAGNRKQVGPGIPPRLRRRGAALRRAAPLRYFNDKRKSGHETG
jgi:hypothetical protein